MKQLSLLMFVLLGLAQLLLAGGNTSIVEIDNISEIKVEDKKITITGSGVIRRRIMSTAEKGDTKVFGQPAQWFYAKVDEGVFVILPYLTPGYKGVPHEGIVNEEMQRRVDELWKGTLARVAKMKKGDAITIGYQADETTLRGVRLTKIVGFGSVRLKAKPVK